MHLIIKLGMHPRKTSEFVPPYNPFRAQVMMEYLKIGSTIKALNVMFKAHIFFFNIMNLIFMESKHQHDFGQMTVHVNIK